MPGGFLQAPCKSVAGMGRRFGTETLFALHWWFGLVWGIEPLVEGRWEITQPPNQQSKPAIRGKLIDLGCYPRHCWKIVSKSRPQKAVEGHGASMGMKGLFQEVENSSKNEQRGAVQLVRRKLPHIFSIWKGMGTISTSRERSATFPDFSNVLLGVTYVTWIARKKKSGATRAISMAPPVGPALRSPTNPSDGEQIGAPRAGGESRKCGWKMVGRRFEETLTQKGLGYCTTSQTMTQKGLGSF